MQAPRREDGVFFLPLFIAVALVLLKTSPVPSSDLPTGNQGTAAPSAQGHGASSLRGRRGWTGPPGWGAPLEGNAHLGSNDSIPAPRCRARHEYRLLNVSSEKAGTLSKEENLEFPVS